MSITSSNLASQRKPQSEVLIEIERFVKTVMERGGAYLPGWNHGQRRDYCDGILTQIPSLLAFFEPEHEYSEHIEAFWQACEKVGLLNCGYPTTMVEQLFSPGKDSAPVVEELVLWILHFAYSPYFNRRASDRRYEQEMKRIRLNTYSSSILAKYARTLVLRVDFGYRKGAMIDVADVYFHLDRLLSMIHRRLGVFQNMVGYAICVEQGETRGYHLHFALFLPGHLHQRDGYLVKQLGGLWSQISDGLGTHHSCNAKKKVYEAMGKRGVGMIHRDDDMELDNSVEAVGYLADPEKENQFLRMKPVGRRTFATGIIETDRQAGMI
jgi:hypothetical protein